MKFRAVSCPSNSVSCWNGEFLVFNERSGDTHLLGALAGQVLLTLRQAPLAARSPAQLFPPVAKADAQRDLEFQIEDILADLESLALIERA